MSEKARQARDSDADYFAPRDPDAMLARIGEFPRQIEHAWSVIGKSGIGPDLAKGTERVLVAGMGGSAIGGDLVAGLVADRCPAPIVVHRSYGVPAWVDERTLFIASSYSGNTEETLDAWDAAAAAGARTVAITTGGELARRAEAEGAATIRFDYKAQPRAALGYSFTLLYGLLARLELIDAERWAPDQSLEILRAAGKTWEPATGLSTNRAKQLAQDYRNRVPVILGAGHLGAVARRWVTQINENAKAWAAWDQFPELNHNMVVGLGHPNNLGAGGGSKSRPGQGDGLDRLLRITLLRSPSYDERTARRMDVTSEILEGAGLPWTEVAPPGGANRLAELLSCVWLGDYTSYYLACLYDEDPTPVKAIDFLKRRLREA